MKIIILIICQMNLIVKIKIEDTDKMKYENNKVR